MLHLAIYTYIDTYIYINIYTYNYIGDVDKILFTYITSVYW
jgi:hypothetical protein